MKRILVQMFFALGLLLAGTSTEGHAQKREGKVMVTLERQQPVFHMTLAGQP